MASESWCVTVDGSCTLVSPSVMQPMCCYAVHGSRAHRFLCLFFFSARCDNTTGCTASDRTLSCVIHFPVLLASVCVFVIRMFGIPRNLNVWFFLVNTIPPDTEIHERITMTNGYGKVCTTTSTPSTSVRPLWTTT